MVRGILDFTANELGLDLYPKQAEALLGVAQHPESLLALGRRGGKTLIACCWATYDAVIRDLSVYLRPGEPRVIAVVATSQQQAGIAFRTIRAFFDLPRLAPLLNKETPEELHLSTGVIVRCLPCSSRSIRGHPVSTAIMDEAAHFFDTTDGYQAGEQIYRALSPSVAQFGDEGRVISLSTPRGKRGIFWRLRQSLGADAYVMEAPTWAMNPAISQAFLDREKAKDPELYAQEYGAEWLDSTASAFLPGDTVDKALGVPEHQHGKRVLTIDPAFARDSFGIALACQEGDRVHIERVEALTPPLTFGAAMDAVASLAAEHGVTACWTDQFASAAVVDELNRRGLHCQVLNWAAGNKSAAYLSLKAGLNSGHVRLVDDERLVAELRALEATPTAAGFAVEAGHGHDDLASAVALACWVLRGEGKRWASVPFLSLGQGLQERREEIRGRQQPRRIPETWIAR